MDTRVKTPNSIPLPWKSKDKIAAKRREELIIFCK
jgi:hypothetical protein